MTLLITLNLDALYFLKTYAQFISIVSVFKIQKNAFGAFIFFIQIELILYSWDRKSTTHLTLMYIVFWHKKCYRLFFICLLFLFSSQCLNLTSLKIFKHYKLKPSFSIMKDEKNKVGVGDKPPHPSFNNLINFDQI